MKLYLILLNVLGIVAYLIWFGYHYLRALGGAFGNAAPSAGPGDVVYVFVVVGLATTACAAYSFFAPEHVARFVALAPIVLILLGQGFIAYRTSSNRAQHDRAQVAQKATRDRKLDHISKDYVFRDKKPDEPGDFKESFLTHDKDLNVLVRIDVGYRSEISAFPFGRIDGDRLETFDIATSEKFYRRYVDAEGQSVFDRYKIRHRPNQDLKIYRLERYDP